MEETVNYLIDVCLEHNFDKISLIKIIKLNNLNMQKFVLTVCFHQTTDKNKLKCLHSFMNSILQTHTNISTDYELFHKEDFKSERVIC